jgi:phosphatidylglycerophosphate synthase
MGMVVVIGLLAYISILLTISFFVLFSVRKTESRGLKKFGKLIAFLLWVVVVLILLSGIYAILGREGPMIPMRRGPDFQQQRMR